MNSNNNFGMEEHSLVCLGGGGVGKSALTIRLVTDQFLEDYDPTIEDSYRKATMLDGEPIILNILDTAGQTEFSAMQDSWIREGQGFLLVYSVDSQISFDEIKTLFQKILRTKDADPGEVAIVLAGNKCDLEDSRREVSLEKGKELAKELGLPESAFFETSAKKEINNLSCYLEVVREIRRLSGGQAPKKDRKQKVRQMLKKFGGAQCPML
jgi:GTPase KRas protein